MPAAVPKSGARQVIVYKLQTCHLGLEGCHATKRSIWITGMGFHGGTTIRSQACHILGLPGGGVAQYLSSVRQTAFLHDMLFLRGDAQPLAFQHDMLHRWRLFRAHASSESLESCQTSITELASILASPEDLPEDMFARHIDQDAPESKAGAWWIQIVFCIGLCIAKLSY